ncbi:UPF0179 family protein [Methanobacterium sp. MBAC-LM]|jgi:uncharacterized protein (UPF0179 family)|uniref:UPF0179 family protein n=1 Tax=Methanobacterium sp. MBAC-LM TaxID=3412034 RepID=UPI003C73DB04
MITLIGKTLAEEGLKFMHYGASAECEACRFKSTCIDSLEEGRMYVVTEVKDTEQPCPIHDSGKVKVVEVERADIEALVDTKKAFEGSMLTFEFPECDKECTMRELCFPEGLYEGDKCKIIKSIGKPANECINGLKLSLVLLK